MRSVLWETIVPSLRADVVVLTQTRMSSPASSVRLHVAHGPGRDVEVGRDLLEGARVEDRGALGLELGDAVLVDRGDREVGVGVEPHHHRGDEEEAPRGRAGRDRGHGACEWAPSPEVPPHWSAARGRVAAILLASEPPPSCHPARGAATVATRPVAALRRAPRPRRRVPARGTRARCSGRPARGTRPRPLPGAPGPSSSVSAASTAAARSVTRASPSVPGGSSQPVCRRRRSRAGRARRGRRSGRRGGGGDDDLPPALGVGGADVQLERARTASFSGSERKPWRVTRSVMPEPANGLGDRRLLRAAARRCRREPGRSAAATAAARPRRRRRACGAPADRGR